MRSLEMPPTYRVGRIAAAQIEAAHLLVDRIAPALSLEQWRADCREAIGRKGRRSDEDDVAVAVNPLGYVQGLCVSAVRRHFVYGRILDVSILAVASAADEAGVVADLLRYLRALAAIDACEGIRVWTLGESDWISDLGHPEIDCSHHGALMIRERQATIVA
jgi:hypothetical protein